MTTFFLSAIIAFGALAGDEINNGGGLAENNFYYAYKSLGKNIDLCLETSLCRLSEAEKELLKDIKNSLQEEYETENQLRMISEKKNPGFFVLEGEMKVAKTGDDIGSLIYINTDLIYFKDANGRKKAISVSGATSILIHELGHHHGDHRHESLDLLGSKVSLALEHYTRNFPYLPLSKQVSLSIISSGKINEISKLLIYVGDIIIDASLAFEEKISCPLIGPITMGRKPRGADLHNIHWRETKKKLLSKEYFKFEVDSNLMIFCGKDNLGKYNPRFRLKLSFYAKRANGKWVYKQDSLKLDQYYKPWLLGLIDELPKL